jgi:nucleoside-diphosphate-sugar epimerase
MTEQEQHPPSRSVYITGGTTRCGQGIVRALTQNGHTVSGPAATSNQANILRECGALPVYGDEINAAVVRHNLKLAEADTIVHLVPQALNVPPHIRRDWDAHVEQLHKQNDALFQAAHESDVAYIVLGSYAFIYESSDENSANGPLDEMAPARTANGLPLFEVALEAERHTLERGGCVLRVGYLFSDDADDPLHKLESQLRRGLPQPVGRTNALANWLRAEDLAAPVAAAAVAQPEGAIYNIVGDAPLSAYAFLEQFCAGTGLRMPIGVPAPVAARLYGPTNLTLLNSSAPLSNAKAKAELNWTLKYPQVNAALDDVLLTWRATRQLV